jgi:SsrA-binding protein
VAKKKKQAADTDSGSKLILRNRKLTHDYEVMEEWECGLVLMGSEVKSLRNADVQWADTHARLDRKGELWLYNLHIDIYKEASLQNHEPTRPRKLLLKARELSRIGASLQPRGLTLVPNALYFKKGFVKLSLCLVRGKKHQDKRSDLKKRSENREIDREMARRQRGR